MPNEKLMSVIIPVEVHTKLKKHCDNNGLKINHFVVKAIESSLVKKNKE
jgi:hypothetical protein